jgi:hypothetical protein
MYVPIILLFLLPSRKVTDNKKAICICAIAPVALVSLLIGTEERRRLPAGKQGRPKRPNINLVPIRFFSFLPTGKVADIKKAII